MDGPTKFIIALGIALIAIAASCGPRPILQATHIHTRTKTSIRGALKAYGRWLIRTATGQR